MGSGHSRCPQSCCVPRLGLGNGRLPGRGTDLTIVGRLRDPLFDLFTPLLARSGRAIRLFSKAGAWPRPRDFEHMSKRDFRAVVRSTGFEADIHAATNGTHAANADAIAGIPASQSLAERGQTPAA